MPGQAPEGTYCGKLRGRPLALVQKLINVWQAINQFRFVASIAAKEPGLAMHGLQWLAVCQTNHNKVLPQTALLGHMKHES